MKVSYRKRFQPLMVALLSALGACDGGFGLGSSGECPNDAVCESVQWEDVPLPIAYGGAHAITTEDSLSFTVQTLGPYAPAVIVWGDGEEEAVIAEGTYAHTFENPGQYPVKLEYADGLGSTEPHLVTVTSADLRPVVTDLSVELTGAITRDGILASGRYALFDPALTGGPSVMVSVSAQSAGTITGSLFLDTFAQAGMPAGTFEVEVTDPSVPATVTSGPLPIDTAGIYQVHTLLDAPFSGDATVDTPITYQVFDHAVTPEECEEIREQYERLRGDKAAKRNDCEELRRRLAELEEALAAAEEALAGLQGQKADLEQQKADAESDFQELWEEVENWLGGNGMLVEYQSAGDRPAGYNFIGSGGIGIAFSSVEQLLADSREYKQRNGHSLTSRTRTLAKMKKDIADLDGAIQSKCDEIDEQQSEIDDLKQQIDDLKQAIEDCENECDGIQLLIDDLVALHEDCLDQLARQREAEREIQDAEEDATRGEAGASAVEGEGDSARDVIDGRSGTPAQQGDDHDTVAEGDDLREDAEGKLEDARDALDDARDALENGDPDTAKTKAEEAADLVAEAQELLRRARERIREGRTSAGMRPRRQCDEGTRETGTTFTRTIWDEILDVALSAYGGTPEQWATALANGREAVEGLQNFLKMLDLLGEVTDTPIGGTITPDADEAVEGIFNAYLRIIDQHFAFDLWVKLRGHTAWTRTDRVCIDGLWVFENHSGENNDSVTANRKIGTIWPGDDDFRKQQMANLLSRFARANGINQ